MPPLLVGPQRSGLIAGADTIGMIAGVIVLAAVVACV
jgi:hypothetical protein